MKKVITILPLYFLFLLTLFYKDVHAVHFCRRLKINNIGIIKLYLNENSADTNSIVEYVYGLPVDTMPGIGISWKHGKEPFLYVDTKALDRGDINLHIFHKNIADLFYKKYKENSGDYLFWTDGLRKFFYLE